MVTPPTHPMNSYKMFFFALLQLPHMKMRTTVTPHPPQVRGALPGGCAAMRLDARAFPQEHTRHSCWESTSRNLVLRVFSAIVSASSCRK